MKSMYSLEWFDAYSARVPSDVVEREVAALADLLPISEYPRILDVGCGIGRIAGPLARRGYATTGVDASPSALRAAQAREPGPRYVALDQAHVGLQGWRFDAALVLWNSLGFVSRAEDARVMAGIGRVLRPNGLVVMDMYHPDWLRQTGDVGSPSREEGGVRAHRWLDGGRLCHRFDYGDAGVDHVSFEVYDPDELTELVEPAGFTRRQTFVWWDASVPPSPAHARYQMTLERTSNVDDGFGSGMPPGRRS